MTRKMRETTKIVALGTRKFCVSAANVESMARRSAQDEDEQCHERQVDEVHALHQTDDQEHGRVQSACGLGLTRDALDDRGAREAVADGRADGAAAEGEPAADHGQTERDVSGDAFGGLGQNAHLSPRFLRAYVVGSGGGADQWWAASSSLPTASL